MEVSNLSAGEAPDANNDSDQPISTLLNRILQQYDQYENNSAALDAAAIDSTLKLCSRLQEMVQQLRLFSSNETIEDVTTESLRFILLPALTAFFWSQRSVERAASLRRSVNEFTQFLTLCQQLQVEDAPSESTIQALATIVANDAPIVANVSRETKIFRLKQKRSIDQQLINLRQAVEKEHVDEETKRNYWLTLIHKWMLLAEEEAMACKQELPLAIMMESRQQQQQQQPQPQQPPANQAAAAGVGKNFILTRDQLQATVFGAGYPSLPTYTIEQWCDHQIATGRLPGQQQQQQQQQQQLSEVDAEQQKRAANDAAEDDEDDEHLQQQRRWDEWKDEHRRGDGNRYRKG